LRREFLRKNDGVLKSLSDERFTLFSQKIKYKRKKRREGKQVRCFSLKGWGEKVVWGRSAKGGDKLVGKGAKAETGPLVKTPWG